MGICVPTNVIFCLLITSKSCSKLSLLYTLPSLFKLSINSFIFNEPLKSPGLFIHIAINSSLIGIELLKLQ